jgi:hypothetical protein
LSSTGTVTIIESMILSALLAVTAMPPKLPYTFEASFVESCSCKEVCVTEITGRDAGCHGLGAIRFRKGSYGGKDISGAASAFAFDSGKWVRIYIDAPKDKRAAVTSFMKAVLADWGKLEEVHTATVRISNTGGVYRLFVDKGHTAGLEMRAVLGGDGHSPVSHGNLGSPLHSTLMQGRTGSAHFSDTHSFKLTNSNGFFNEKCVMKGEI